MAALAQVVLGEQGGQPGRPVLVVAPRDHPITLLDRRVVGDAIRDLFPAIGEVQGHGSFPRTDGLSDWHTNHTVSSGSSGERRHGGHPDDGQCTETPQRRTARRRRPLHDRLLGLRRAADGRRTGRAVHDRHDSRRPCRSGQRPGRHRRHDQDRRHHACSPVGRASSASRRTSRRSPTPRTSTGAAASTVARSRSSATTSAPPVPRTASRWRTRRSSRTTCSPSSTASSPMHRSARPSSTSASSGVPMIQTSGKPTVDQWVFAFGLRPAYRGAIDADAVDGLSRGPRPPAQGRAAAVHHATRRGDPAAAQAGLLRPTASRSSTRRRSSTAPA